MPQRQNFDFKSKTLAPVFGTVGVLSTSLDNHSTIIGAYYDRAPEYAGLYIIHSDASIQYHEIDPATITPAGLSNMISFSDGGQDYLIRDLVEDDGEWISEYKIDLPLVALYQTVLRNSKPAIDLMIGVQMPDSMPVFEAMFAYYMEGNPEVHSIVYMSNFGIYSRIDAAWEDVDIAAKNYQKLSSIEIDSSKAKELLDLFDSKSGWLLVSDATEFADKGGVK